MKINRKKKAIWIYVLRLEEEKCYVGQTVNINERIKSHFSGNGSAWTKRYRPVDVLLKIETRFTHWQDALDAESDITLKMAKLFGTSNVRGGRWSASNLAPVGSMVD